MSTDNINKWKLWCYDEDTYVFWLLEDDTIPDKCPNDSAHSVDINRRGPIKEYDSTQTVIVREEPIPTGGHFAATTMRVEADPNTTSFVDKSFPYPVSALSVEFVVCSENTGDIIDVTVGEDTPVGVTLAPTTPVAEWTPSNYMPGQVVEFNHPKFGCRVYTCIQIAGPGDFPVDPLYWKHGYPLTTTQTALQYADPGFNISLFNGLHKNNLGRVIDKDLINNVIYVEKSPTNTFSPIATYVLMTVYMMRDYELGPPWGRVVGESKIGGSYTPADTIVRIYYHNKSPDQSKVFVGSVEYLY